MGRELSVFDRSIPSFHFLGRKDHSSPQKMCKMRQCMGRELVCRDLWMDHVSVCDLCTETVYMHNNLNLNSTVSLSKRAHLIVLHPVKPPSLSDMYDSLCEVP